MQTKLVELSGELKLYKETNGNEMSSWKGKCNRAEKDLKRAFDEWSNDKALMEALKKEKEQLLH